MIKEYFDKARSPPRVPLTEPGFLTNNLVEKINGEVEQTAPSPLGFTRPHRGMKLFSKLFITKTKKKLFRWSNIL